jgi:RimJ/RimL family protein N-acetyltransferase
MLTGTSLQLRHWSERHRGPFAAMHADPEVMLDLGGPIDRAASDAKFDRYREAWSKASISRWAVETPEGTFAGYVGVMARTEGDHPLGPHHEIGWRFRRETWGNGYATQGARLALGHAWTTLSVDLVLSYTAPTNLRSQRVMQRLGLRRDPFRVAAARPGAGTWTGLVWVADRPAPA